MELLKELNGTRALVKLSVPQLSSNIPGPRSAEIKEAHSSCYHGIHGAHSL